MFSITNHSANLEFSPCVMSVCISSNFIHRRNENVCCYLDIPFMRSPNWLSMCTAVCAERISRKTDDVRAEDKRRLPRPRYATFSIGKSCLNSYSSNSILEHFGKKIHTHNIYVSLMLSLCSETIFMEIVFERVPEQPIQHERILDEEYSKCFMSNNADKMLCASCVRGEKRG